MVNSQRKHLRNCHEIMTCGTFATMLPPPIASGCFKGILTYDVSTVRQCEKEFIGWAVRIIAGYWSNKIIGDVRADQKWKSFLNERILMLLELTETDRYLYTLHMLGKKGDLGNFEKSILAFAINGLVQVGNSDILEALVKGNPILHIKLPGQYGASIELGEEANELVRKILGKEAVKRTDQMDWEVWVRNSIIDTELEFVSLETGIENTVLKRTCGTLFMDILDNRADMYLWGAVIALGQDENMELSAYDLEMFTYAVRELVASGQGKDLESLVEPAPGIRTRWKNELGAKEIEIANIVLRGIVKNITENSGEL